MEKFKLIVKRIINWISKSNIFLYSISLWAITSCMRLLVDVFKYIFNISDIQFSEPITDKNTKITIDLLLDTLIIAPILETIIFQTLFFVILTKFKINKWIIVLVSGVTFGAIHYYSIFYMINTTLVGVVFIYFYILRAESNKRPFVSTMIAHATINLITLIFILLKPF